MININFFAIIILVCITFNHSCIFSGSVEGECLNTRDISDITFCSNYLPESICVPFKSDIWTDFNTKIIDSTIEKNVIESLSTEFELELRNSNGFMPIINSAKCWNMYIEFICRSSFRACDKTKNKSYKVCTTYCKNYKIECGYPDKGCNLETEQAKSSDSSEVLNKNEFDDPPSPENNLKIETSMKYNNMTDEIEALITCK